MSSCNTKIHQKKIYKGSLMRFNLADSPKNHNKKTLLSSLSGMTNGSMTIEASLALPVFLFFMINLLSLFTIYERYSKNLAELYERGRKLAIVAYSFPEGGEMVDLFKVQEMSPLYAHMGFDNAYTKVSIHLRKWTGYDVMSTTSLREEEEYVYITESGTVYHRSRECSHLKVTVHIIDAKDASGKRNDYGQSYKPCEKCAVGCSTGLVFITDKGDRYHNSASCSGLKRTIKTVPISEVGERGECSMCGGRR